MNEIISDRYRDITGFTIFQLGVQNSIHRASDKWLWNETTDNTDGA